MRLSTRSPIFWAALVLMSAAGLAFTWKYFPRAFPIVSLDIRMTRAEALRAAAAFDSRVKWAPEGYRQAASFDSDDEVQNYVELQGGGAEGFERFLKAGLYRPYQWTVRLFREGERSETRVWFTPEGELYGFARQLPEALKGPALPAARARSIAEREATARWKVDLGPYHLVESSREERPGGRVDHVFVYERTGAKAVEAPYRLKLVLQGDTLGGLARSVQVPESFKRRYAEMRAANNTLSTLASIAIGLAMVLGGGGGILWLARRRELEWRPALLAGGVISGFQALDSLNRLPLEWMRYDTAESASQFLAGRILSASLEFLGGTLLLGLVLMAAEGLTRKAFPRQPQLWKAWSPQAAASPEILGRTLGGYLWVGIDFAFVTALYVFARGYLGWWSPSSEPFHPDVLATYAPWLTPIASSLAAGTIEEALFRAIPIASGALAGARFGKRGLGIALGFVFQVLVFSAAHANYPGQPAYARLMELLIPSAVFGALYLRFGLLPGIVLHYVFDVVWFALPVFAADSSETMLSRALIVAGAAVPLLVVLTARLGSRVRVKAIPGTLLNASWRRPATRGRAGAPVPRVGPRGRLRPGLAAAFALAALGIGGGAMLHAVRRHDSVPLGVDRSAAIGIARKALEERGTALSPEWTALADAEGNNGSESVFVWRTAGDSLYHRLLGTHLDPPEWRVRFVRFGAPVEERAEEHQVFISGKGEVRRVRHELPEARAGASLGMEEARRLARRAIRERLDLDVSGWKEVTAQARKRPARLDWAFAYSSPARLLPEGELRVAAALAGDEVTGVRRYVQVPEEWERKWREDWNREGILDSLRSFLRGLVYVWVALVAIRTYARRRFPVRGLGTAFAVLSAVLLASVINELPAGQADFGTSEPVGQQWTRLAVSELAMSAVMALVGAVALGFSTGLSAGRSTRLSRGPVAAVVSAGALAAAIQGSALLLIPKSWPALGSLAGAEEWIPPLSMLSLTVAVITKSAFWMFLLDRADQLTSGWSRRRRTGAGALAILGFVLEAGSFHSGVQAWALLGLVGALTLPALAWLVRRAGFACVPLFIGGRIAFGTVMQAAPPFHPDAVAQAAVGAALCLGCAAWMYRRLAGGGGK